MNASITGTPTSALLGKYLLAVSGLCMAAGAHANEKSTGAPGCAHESAQQCVTAALEAMGGRERLQQVASVRLQTVGHTLLMEQSYRQAPFIAAYERGHTTMDLTNRRLLTETKLTWPESDPNQSDSDTTLVVGPNGGVYHTKFGDSPCSLGDLDVSQEALALGPARVLLTASGASDLHFEPPETLRTTSHAVVAFNWRHIPVRVLLNPFNHLPDAVETTRVFHDFWYFWGDVRQRIYFDNWKLIEGVTFPTNSVEERNGTVWSSKQALNVEFNVQMDEKTFDMNAGAVAQSAASPGWNDTLYDPELMYEVAQAVKRENLIVDTVFAMHQGPIPWEKVLGLIEKSRHS